MGTPAATQPATKFVLRFGKVKTQLIVMDASPPQENLQTSFIGKKKLVCESQALAFQVAETDTRNFFTTQCI